MFEIFAYGNGDFFQAVFNAIAMIFGNDDYLVAMNIAALLGFVGILVKAAFDRDGFQNFKWLFAMLLFYMAAVVPKETVLITDVQVPALTYTVDNVPLGVAATASFVSTFSRWMTSELDTVLSDPTLSYSNNSALYGVHLVQELTRARILDGNLQLNFNEFFISCVLIDAIGNDRMDWESIMRTPDIVLYFQNNLAANTAYFAYRGAGVVQYLPCHSGFVNQIQPDLVVEVNAARLRMATKLYPYLSSTADAVAKLNNDLSGVVNTMTGVSQPAGYHIVQSMMVNGLSSGARKAVSTTSATVPESIIEDKASYERELTFRETGKLASTKMPLIKTLFEAFLYAVFPIVVLMALISPAKVSLNYAKALLWIGFWSPIYALLNFAFTYYSSTNLINIIGVYSDTPGLSLDAMSSMQYSISEMSSTAGYLSLSIPMIAWLFVSQSGAMMASVAGRVLQGYDSSVSKASSDMASGHISHGANTYQATSDGRMLNTHYDSQGNQHTMLGNGRVLSQYASSSAQDLTVSVGDSVMQSIGNKLSNAKSETSAMSAEERDSRINAYQAAQKAASEVNKTSGKSDNVNNADRQSFNTEMSTVASEMEKFSNSKGFKFSDMTSFDGEFIMKLSTSQSDDKEVRQAKEIMDSAGVKTAMASANESAKSFMAKDDQSVSDATRHDFDASMRKQHDAAIAYKNAKSHEDKVTQEYSTAQSVTSSITEQGIGILDEAGIAAYGPNVWRDIVNRAAKHEEDAVDMVNRVAKQVVNDKVQSKISANENETGVDKENINKGSDVQSAVFSKEIDDHAPNVGAGYLKSATTKQEAIFEQDSLSVSKKADPSLDAVKQDITDERSRLENMYTENQDRNTKGIDDQNINRIKTEATIVGEYQNLKRIDEDGNPVPNVFRGDYNPVSAPEPAGTRIEQGVLTGDLPAQNVPPPALHNDAGENVTVSGIPLNDVLGHRPPSAVEEPSKEVGPLNKLVNGEPPTDPYAPKDQK